MGQDQNRQRKIHPEYQEFRDKLRREPAAGWGRTTTRQAEGDTVPHMRHKAEEAYMVHQKPDKASRRGATPAVPGARQVPTRQIARTQCPDGRPPPSPSDRRLTDDGETAKKAESGALRKHRRNRRRFRQGRRTLDGNTARCRTSTTTQHPACPSSRSRLPPASRSWTEDTTSPTVRREPDGWCLVVQARIPVDTPD